jgi:hypothetical protein
MVVLAKELERRLLVEAHFLTLRELPRLTHVNLTRVSGVGVSADSVRGFCPQSAQHGAHRGEREFAKCFADRRQKWAKTKNDPVRGTNPT